MLRGTPPGVQPPSGGAPPQYLLHSLEAFQEQEKLHMASLALWRLKIVTTGFRQKKTKKIEGEEEGGPQRRVAMGWGGATEGKRGVILPPFPPGILGHSRPSSPKYAPALQSHSGAPFFTCYLQCLQVILLCHRTVTDTIDHGTWGKENTTQVIHNTASILYLQYDPNYTA